MTHLALSPDAAVADALLLGQSRTPCRLQHAHLTQAVHNIRLAERQRLEWERRGVWMAQSGELWEALHNPRLIEGESVWQVR